MYENKNDLSKNLSPHETCLNLGQDYTNAKDIMPLCSTAGTWKNIYEFVHSGKFCIKQLSLSRCKCKIVFISKNKKKLKYVGTK